ncbi:MAG: hypothetical protein PHG83_01080 [Patescibacteria group bacterium]|nr:hypothetical protein [Patescibacteria group bacterium]
MLYMGWKNFPWKLVTDNGEVDLWPVVDEFLASLNNKRAKYEGSSIVADESSKYKFKYAPCEYVVLAEDSGILNVRACLDNDLIWLSGRKVEIEIEDGKQMKFVADKSEEVLGVYFMGGGNSCEVPKGMEQTVCKCGQSDCCIFLTIGTGGFRCEKFSGPMARLLLDRLAKGTIRASRIGNCSIIGRK